MKKIFALLLALIMVMGLVACGAPAAPAATEAPKAETPAAPEAEAPAAPAEKTPADYTGNLVVYSPHDADPLAAGVALFEKTYPNIKVEVIAAGTGELCQRVVAESGNPQGDVLWGGGADTLAAYVDYFDAYVCANDDVIGDAYKDAADLWIGESPLPMVFVYNKTMIDEADVPQTWDDLCNENLKGKIAYASPAKSGSAYTQLCTMLFSKPTLEEGWDLVQKFIDNLPIFSLLANVADVKSLVIHPASTTHSQLTEEELAEQGIKPNTIRLSIGTEHIDDLIDALDTAFAAIK